jgi:hypothetical protein
MRLKSLFKINIKNDTNSGESLRPMNPRRDSSRAASPSGDRCLPATTRTHSFRQISDLATRAASHTGDLLRKISSGTSTESTDIPSIRMPDRNEGGGPMFQFTATPPANIPKPIAIRPGVTDEEY